MHEGFGVLQGCCGAKDIPVLAGQVSHRRGSRLRYMAGWHSGTQLSPARLQGKQRTFAPKATGYGDSTQPIPVSSSPSVLQHPQPAVQEVLESQPAF